VGVYLIEESTSTITDFYTGIEDQHFTVHHKNRITKYYEKDFVLAFDDIDDFFKLLRNQKKTNFFSFDDGPSTSVTNSTMEAKSTENEIPENISMT
jgi:hypothetical protein